jgi:DNA polymerase-1
VTKEQRRIGKTVNFGVVYGISGFGLGDRLKIGTEEAQKFIDNFYNSYPKVKIYFEKLKAEARNTGFVETIFGRRKDAAGLNNPNYQFRMGAEREIINFPLQGSAADLMKMAMIEASKYLLSLKNGKNSNGKNSDGKYSDEKYKMVLQVHDELIFEIPEDIKLIANFVSDIKNIMMGVCKLDLPLIVEANYAKRWGDLK